MALDVQASGCSVLVVYLFHPSTILETMDTPPVAIVTQNVYFEQLYLAQD
jgi:hypothetical protein